jgi:hypothetical protein
MQIYDQMSMRKLMFGECIQEHKLFQNDPKTPLVFTSHEKTHLKNIFYLLTNGTSLNLSTNSPDQNSQ